MKLYSTARILIAFFIFPFGCGVNPQKPLETAPAKMSKEDSLEIQRRAKQSVEKKLFKNLR
ncbi:MAG: hypothetical protein MK066_10865 [Crocinitomicaceae bacterium]|nr:hypothetical protein [Crocinitomicaceae bacterium]